MGKMLMIEGVLSYPQQLWEAGQYDGAGAFYWSSTCILNPNIPAQAKCIAELEEAEKAEFRAVWEKGKSPKPDFEKAFAARSESERTVRDGDLKGGEYEGCKYVAARATVGKQAKPVVLDRQARAVTADGMLIGPDGQPTKMAAAGVPYAGAICVFQVELWAQYDGKYKRNNTTLMGVQFKKDGEAFGGGRPADMSKFQALADTGEDEDNGLAGLA